jgi:predicted TIM-barrel fold metal-dependent hydrolase
MPSDRVRKVDVEGHFFTPEYLALLQAREQPPRQEVSGDSVRLWVEPSVPDLYQQSGRSLLETLLDVGDARIAAMDAAGVDVQVLSLSNPAIEQLEPSVGTAAAREANDRLADAVSRHPTRFWALASVAPAQPEEAAIELERCVRQLGFRGLMLRTHARDEFLDGPAFRPIFAAAAELGVPVYLHPTVPHARLIGSLLGFGWSFPGPGFGYGVETAIHTLRLIHSGLLDEHADLQLLVGLLGAGLTFWMYRFDFEQSWMAGRRGPRLDRKVSDYLRENVNVTTSGTCLHSALTSVIKELGVDRVLFASDYPFTTLREAADFIEDGSLSVDERETICYRNAERLFSL